MDNYIRIPEELARKLQAIAEREDTELATTVGEAIDAQTDDRPWATLGDLELFAREARKRMNGDAPSEMVDDSLRSREILNAEFADYLISRTQP